MTSLEAGIKIYRPTRLVGTGAKAREALAAAVLVWNFAGSIDPNARAALTLVGPAETEGIGHHHGAELNNPSYCRARLLVDPAVLGAACLQPAPGEGRLGGSSWEHSHPTATRKGVIEFEANLQGFDAGDLLPCQTRVCKIHNSSHTAS